MFKALVVTRLKYFLYSFTAGRNKKQAKTMGAGLIVLLVFCLIFLCFAFGTIWFSVGWGLIPAGFESLYFSLAFILAFAFCFLGSVFVTQKEIYEAKDNDLLLSMPIRPILILFSRLTALILLSLLYQLIIMLPAYIAYVLIAGFDLATFLIFLLLNAMLPFLSVAVSSIVGWILAMISRKLGGKNIITVAVSLLGLVLYFYIYGQMQNIIDGITSAGGELTQLFQTTLYPVFAFGSAVASHGILELLTAICICAVPFALMAFLLSRNFLKIVAGKGTGKKKQYIAGSMKTSSSYSALLKKEGKHFFGNPMYLLNAGMGYILMIGVAVFSVFKAEDLRALLLQVPQLADFKTAVCLFILCFMGATGVISAPSISIEGKTIWQLKVIPVPVKNILRAKADLHILVACTATIFSAIILSFTVGLTVLQTIFLIVISCLFHCLCAYAGLYINLLLPKFDWINETAAIKQSASVLITMLAMLTVTGLSVALLFILGNATWFLAVTGILYALLALGSFELCMHAGVKRFQAL